MDHLYSDYFLNLAQVSIGFVAFSTICLVLREMMGRPLDRFQTLLVRFVIECGLAATTYALIARCSPSSASPLHRYGAWRARHSASTASSTRSTTCIGVAE